MYFMLDLLYDLGCSGLKQNTLAVVRATKSPVFEVKNDPVKCRAHGGLCVQKYYIKTLAVVSP